MSVLALLHVVFSSSIVLYALSANWNHGSDLLQPFGEYIRRYNKTYELGTKEFLTRLSNFQETLRRINMLNKRRNSTEAAIYGLTQFSDLTRDEFLKYVHLEKPDPSLKKIYPMKNRYLNNPKMKGLPKTVDWRDKHIITAVNNQDSCGACWAYSIVETIESMYALKTGILEKWSVQQILDCAAPPNRGCGGGDTCLAAEWLHEDDVKLVLAKDYPFTAETGECQQNVKSDKTVQIARNFTCDSFVGEEYLMLLHLAHHGPLIAAVDATGWQDYQGGIILDNCDSERNHAVQIVGYDIRGEIPFYIVRNSWGTKFGNGGYLKIKVGKNVCRIAEEVTALDVL